MRILISTLVIGLSKEVKELKELIKSKRIKQLKYFISTEETSKILNIFLHILSKNEFAVTKPNRLNNSIIKAILNIFKEILVGAISGILVAFATPKIQEFIHCIEHILQ